MKIRLHLSIDIVLDSDDYIQYLKFCVYPLEINSSCLMCVIIVLSNGETESYTRLPTRWTDWTTVGRTTNQPTHINISQDPQTEAHFTTPNPTLRYRNILPR